MSSGSLAESMEATKRKRQEVRAALAASRAEGKHVKREEDAVARHWVLPEEGRWYTITSSLGHLGGLMKFLQPCGLEVLRSLDLKDPVAPVGCDRVPSVQRTFGACR